MREFCGCYLLVSKAPEARGRTYIGFTVNPRRRIRQHNGLIKAGAWKTTRGRPWEMTLVVYGFPTKVQALQFEWAWQHPQKSIIVRPIAAALGAKRLTGVRGKVLLMLHMLHESPWRHFPLTLQYLAPEYAALVKESVASAPAHMRVVTAPMDDLPRALDDMDSDEERTGAEEEAGQDCGAGSGSDAEAAAGLPRGRRGGGGGAAGSGSDACSSGAGDSGGDEEEPTELDGRTAPASHAAAAAAGAASRARCALCHLAIPRHILACSTCSSHFHLDCLAARWQNAADAGWGGHPAASGGMDAAGAGAGAGAAAADRNRFGGVPEQGHCPACGAPHKWMALLEGMQTVGWGGKARGRRGRGAKATKKATTAAAAAASAATNGDRREQPAPTARGRARGGAATGKRATASVAAADAAAGTHALCGADAGGAGTSCAAPNAAASRTPAAQADAIEQPPAKPKRSRKPCGDAGAGTSVAAAAQPARRKKAAATAATTASGADAAPPGPRLRAATHCPGGLEPGGEPGPPAAAAPRRRAAAGRPTHAACGSAAALPAGAEGGAEGLLAAACARTADASPRKRQALQPQQAFQDSPSMHAPRPGLGQSRSPPEDEEPAEPSPMPLWRRLEARAKAAAATADAAGLAAGEQAASGWPAAAAAATAAAAAAVAHRAAAAAGRSWQLVGSCVHVGDTEDGTSATSSSSISSSESSGDGDEDERVRAGRQLQPLARPPPPACRGRMDAEVVVLGTTSEEDEDGAQSDDDGMHTHWHAGNDGMYPGHAMDGSDSGGFGGGGAHANRAQASPAAAPPGLLAHPAAASASGGSSPPRAAAAPCGAPARSPGGGVTDLLARLRCSPGGDGGGDGSGSGGWRRGSYAEEALLLAPPGTAPPHAAAVSLPAEPSGRPGVDGSGGGRQGRPLAARADGDEGEVVDLCTPQPLARRLAARAAAGASPPACARLHDGRGVAGQQAAAAGGQHACKRLRSPNPNPAAALAAAPGSACGVGGAHEPRGAQASAAQAQHAARAAEAPAPRAAAAAAAGARVQPAQAAGGRGALEPRAREGQASRRCGHQGESPGGWAVSPWPTRRRQEAAGLGFGVEGRGSVQEQDDESAEGDVIIVD